MTSQNSNQAQIAPEHPPLADGSGAVGNGLNCIKMLILSIKAAFRLHHGTKQERRRSYNVTNTKRRARKIAASALNTYVKRERLQTPAQSFDEIPSSSNDVCFEI